MRLGTKPRCPCRGVRLLPLAVLVLITVTEAPSWASVSASGGAGGRNPLGGGTAHHARTILAFLALWYGLCGRGNSRLASRAFSGRERQ